MKNRLLKSSRRRLAHPGLIMALTATVGVTVIVLAMAAPTPAGFEAEAGMRSGGATQVSLSNASKSLAVRFGMGTPAPTPASTPTPTVQVINAYTTGYTYYDNTPPGSADISHPVIHTKAGGTGTYSDPITVAVGHTLSGGQDILDYPAGTKFYIPNVRRYFIVEDTCGDGPTPQNGPCHKGYPAGTSTWLDLWIDGASGSKSAVQACANKITDENGEVHAAIRNPANNYAVVPGPIFQNGQCTNIYGNQLVTKS